MRRKVIFSLTILIASILFQSCGPKFQSWKLSSPDNKLTLYLTWERNTTDKTGNISYLVKHKTGNSEATIILPSDLGIQRDDAMFYSNLRMVEEGEKTEIEDSYSMNSGKQKICTYNGYESSWTFENPTGDKLKFVARIFDNGIAFKYIFPDTLDQPVTVIKEFTSFHLPLQGKAWMQAYDTVTKWTPAYETYWQNKIDIGTLAPKGQGWSFPMLFETSDHWLLISESGLEDNYFASHLQPDASNGLYTIRLPEDDEAMNTGPSEASSTLPWEMPWRVIMVSDNLKGIVENTLITDLAKPNTIEDISWIKSGRASWSWWSDHNSPQRMDKLVKFIDLAAEMGWEYSLVDANWNIMKRGNIEQLTEYANAKGVGILMWYNSGGPHNIVEEQLRDAMHESERRREEFKKLNEMGVKGVKVDFFQSDKPHIIKQYHDLLKDAAEFKILVNFHGCTMPRGWNRTYPHMLTLEAVRGAECYSFDSTYPDLAPSHNTILPFTRNVVGPMDYTPVAFTDQTYPHMTTNSHELALSIVFESGIIHMADRVESYQTVPEFVQEFLKYVPVSWDQTKFISGYPGESCILARQSEGTWYIAGINGSEDPLDTSFGLPFVSEGDYLIEIINDAKEVRAFQFSKRIFEAGSNIDISMKPYGGFVAIIREQE
ncbi:glycoside hydrolase family 97 catalytic domain-containing protein [Bacteroidota bacterium]